MSPGPAPSRFPPKTGFRAAFLAALIALALPATAAAAAVVTFPGPRSAPLPEPGLSVLSVRLPGAATDDLLVGMGGGTLALIHYIEVSDAFEVRQQLAVGGRLVGLLRWEGLPASERGAVVATADPDRVVFVRIVDRYPYLSLAGAVDLDEDPGTLAWFGDLNGGRGQVAVSLPGIDTIALLADQSGWRLRQSVPVGDEPFALAGADLDGDGVREVVAAQRGALSGNLAVLTAGPDGQADVRFAPVPGLAAGLVAAFDDDGDGRDELAIADRDRPQVAFARADGAGFALTGTLALTLPARHLIMWTLAEGASALLAGDPERGASEFASLTATGWVRHEAYFPGCRPLASTTAELNGDGQPDIATVGAGAGILALMFARPGPGFWGLPSLALTALPGDLAHGDFDGDGHADVLVAAALEPRLSLFAARDDGGLETTGRDIGLGFAPGKMVPVELDADPEPELAVLDVMAGQVVILDPDGAGGFREGVRRVVGDFPTFLTAGDIDADGLVDLLAVPTGGARVQLLWGEAGGSFSEATTLTYEIATTSAALLDLNGDGRLDVVGVDGSSRVWWRVNLDGRTFGPGLWLHAGTGASMLAAGDLDGDFDDDLVVGCRVDHSLVSFENDGAGNLVRRTGSYVLDSEPSGLHVGDFDQDGRGDVVVSLRDRDRFDIYLSVVPWNHLYALTVAGTPDVLEFEVADVNADGREDLLALDNALRLGVAHLNVDPDGVALEPRALTVGCGADGSLRVRLEPGLDGPWRLEARLPAGWLRLADGAGAAAGRLEQEGFVWLLAIAPAELAAWGQPTALRLVVDLGDGRSESRTEPVAAPCAAAVAAGGPAWLAGPWPNPGNPAIRARFRLPRESRARVAVHDLAGRRVALLADGVLAAGDHEVAWDGRGPGGAAAAGAYLLRIDTPDGRLARKLVLLK